MPRDRDLHDGLGVSVKQIPIRTANAVQAIKSVHPTNLRSVSSYNWVDTQSPTIGVPGRSSFGLRGS